MKTDLVPALNHFDYFTDIEQTFIRRRGQHLMIGPLDWALIESWQERGIPLRVVLRGINEVFDSVEQRAESAVSVRSLKYCASAVEGCFAEWSSSHVGNSETEEADSDEEAEPLDLRDHINRCAKALENSIEGLPGDVSQTGKGILSELVNLEANADKADIADGLEKLDAKLDSLILENKTSLTNSDIDGDVRRELQRLELAPSSVESASSLIFCRRIRGVYEIPRLNIYEL